MVLISACSAQDVSSLIAPVGSVKVVAEVIIYDDGGTRFVQRFLHKYIQASDVGGEYFVQQA